MRWDREWLQRAWSPDTADAVRMAVALWVEVESERFDRTLPGQFFPGTDEWMPNAMSLPASRARAGLLRRVGRLALEMLDLGDPGELRSRVPTHQARVEALRECERAGWWGWVWNVIREARARCDPYGGG